MRRRMKLLGLLLVNMLVSGSAQNLDRFIYGNTVNRTSGGADFGPPDWNHVVCPNLTNCVGYPDTWWYATDWNIPTTESECLWCPLGGSECNFAQRQSPIDLTREVANPESEIYSECTDDHWMEYKESSCTWENLKNASAFSIERHALRVSIPIRETQDGYRPDCPGERWGVIDFSNGFKWWRLSHTEIHIPSEHTQNGKRYDAEIQMYHLYSLQEYQMATIACYVQADGNVMDDPYINKLICEWRNVEDATRKQCGLSSVPEQYPGCWQLVRTRKRKLRNSKKDSKKPQPQPHKTAYDIMMQQHYHADKDDSRENMKTTTTTTKKKKTAKKFAPPDEETIHTLHDALQDDDPRKHHWNKNWSGYHRNVLNYDSVVWFDYWPLLSVRTEYYHRYFGTATVPPCFGSVPESEANLWRVMKDPIRISQRQLDELNRLLVNRIAPIDDLVNPCQPDTAGVINSTTGRINVARPLQQIQKTYHDNRFCSCEDWHSRWPEDKAWCETFSLTERLTTQPYNFFSNGY